MGDEQAPCRTVAIIDFAHSGSSMVAGICEILGVPMVGDNYDAMKWEDLDVLKALADEQQFALLVAERNARHSVWGFKRVGAWLFPEALAHLRSPVYLAIYKDPVSVTRRRFGASDARLMKKLRNTMHQMMKSINAFYYTFGHPVHTLSYHKAVVTPEAFVQEVAEVIGFGGDKALRDKAAAYIQPNATGKPRVRYADIESWR